MPDNSLRWTVYEAADGWRFRVQAANNEILASGEAYTERRGAEHAVELLGGHLDETHGGGEDWFALLHDAVGEPDDEDAKGLDCA